MKSSLVIIFNQDFSKNIEKLEQLYAHRFKRIRYIVPTTLARWSAPGLRSGRWPVGFYLAIDSLLTFFNRISGRRSKFSILGTQYHRENKSRILSVVGDQYYFYHFISQASQVLLSDDSEWFWFVGDDAVLNAQINQQNFFDFLNLEKGVDAVLCRPVIATDSWLIKIQKSVDSAREKIVKVLGTCTPYKQKLAIDREDVNSQNTEVCVACADFFGVSRDVLERSIEDFNAAIKQRIFVEVCVPNVLLKHANKPVSFSNFTWVSQPSESQLKDMAVQLINSDTVFAHPIKLSSMTNEDLKKLYAQ